MICTSVTCALVASFLILKFMESTSDFFAQKKFPQRLFLVSKFVINTLCNHAHNFKSALCQTILKLLARLFPELYSTHSNYYY